MPKYTGCRGCPSFDTYENRPKCSIAMSCEDNIKYCPCIDCIVKVMCVKPCGEFNLLVYNSPVSHV